MQTISQEKNKFGRTIIIMEENGKYYLTQNDADDKIYSVFILDNIFIAKDLILDLDELAIIINIIAKHQSIEKMVTNAQEIIAKYQESNIS